MAVSVADRIVFTGYIFQPTLGPHSRVVMHDIPVNVVPRRLWEEYQEPSVPQFDVSSIVISGSIYCIFTDTHFFSTSVRRVMLIMTSNEHNAFPIKGFSYLNDYECHKSLSL